jgi:1,4-alpha-glucan branching enzyme
MAVVSNFTPVPRREYRIGVPGPGIYREVINTDNVVYGGSGVGNGLLHAEETGSHGRAWSVVMTVPPLATVMLHMEN